MRYERKSAIRAARLMLVAGAMLFAVAGMATPAMQLLSDTGEGTSPSFSLYLGPGFRPSSGDIGSSQSAAFSLYLGQLSQTYAVSPAFGLDTRIATAIAGIIRSGSSGIPIAGATVELFLGSTRQQATATNPAGEYAFFATVFGEYVVRAYKEGYAMATSDLVRYSGDETIQLGLNLPALGPEPVPDLALGESDLTYTVLSNGSLTITAMIHNNGGEAASNIGVRFYDASTGSGINDYVVIGSDMTLSSLAMGEAKPVSVTWTPPTGHQRFYVFADPNNAIREPAEINNGAARDLGDLGRVPPKVGGVSAQYDGLDDPRLIGRFLTDIEGAENLFSANVSDPDNDIARVKFDFNGTVIEDTSPNGGWSVSFDPGTLPPGNLPLIITAYDAAGLVSEPFVATLIVQDWPWWMKERLVLSSTNFPISYKAEAGYLIFTVRFYNDEYPDKPSLMFFDDLIDPDVLIVGDSRASFDLEGHFTMSFPVSPGLPWKVEGKACIEGSVLDHKDFGTDVAISATISSDGSVLESVEIEFYQEMAIEGFPEMPSPPLFVYGVRIEVGLSMDALLAMRLSGTLTENLTGIDLRLSPQVGAQLNGVLRVSDPFKFARLELILSPRFLLGPELSYVYPPGDMGIAGRFSAEVSAKLVGSLAWNIIKHTFAAVTWGPWEWSYPREGSLEMGQVMVTAELDQVSVPTVFPYPSAASGNAGQVGVTWIGDVDLDEQRLDPEVFFAMRDSLGVWSVAERITTNDRFETVPALSFLPDGRIMAVWVQSSLLESEASESMTLSSILDRQDLWFAIRGEAGWSVPETLIEDVASGYQADGLQALARLNENGAIILWARSVGDSALAAGSGEIFSSVFADSEWSTPSRLTENQADDTAPAVCAAGQDSALAIWMSEEPAGSGVQRLVWAVWEGNGWGIQQTFRESDWKKQGPSLASAPNGDFVATWIEIETLPDSTLRYHLLSLRKPTGQVEWDGVDEIYTDSLFMETPMVLVDQRNIAAVTWRGNDGYDGDLMVALKDLDSPESVWTLPRSLTADTLTDWMATVALDDQNNLHVIDLKSDLSDTTATLLSSNFFDGLSAISRGISNDLSLTDELNFGFRSLSSDLLMAGGSVSIDESHPTVGDAVSIEALVKNIGDVRSAPAAIRFFDGHPDSGGVAMGADVPLSAIAPDSTATGSISWIVESGVHRLYAVVDPLSVVPEQNEGNNIASLSMGVFPDLVVSQMAVSDPNPAPGDSITVATLIRNRGGSVAEGFSVRFSGHTGVLSTVSDLSIFPVDSLLVSARFEAAAGVDTIQAIADPDSLTADPNRADNRGTMQLLVLPDLAVPADSIAYLDFGSSGELSAIITNEGGVGASSFLVSFYRGNPLVGGVLLDTLRVNALVSGSQIRLETPWTAPLGLSTIYVVADEGDFILERDEGNNESYRDVIKGVLPDVSIDPETFGTRYVTEDSLMLEVAVSNIGAANALGVTVEFFRGDPDSGGVLIADRLIVALDIDATTIVSVPWLEPDSLVNLIFVVVDRSNMIAEFSEENNEISQQFGAVSGVDEETLLAAPTAVALHQPYPNPFNACTMICFELPTGAHAKLAIYDVAGRLVRGLASRVMQPGRHSLIWDGRNDRGRTVASGVYFCRLEADRKMFTKKLVLLR